ncbi:MAG: 50S ribosomal protein L3 [Eubacteriales bacterium]|jgi:large subunit ribosomal protein L3|nr:50S ribosomal protein L3 [Eubacteriales bacterium]MCI6573226.1 50S ribosomal protein L3 [Bacillota bacterium]MDY5585950.1 50S ribosomal protein L3 [Eubacteriales bacterium]
MKKAILGKKLGMTQIFTPDGLVIPVTVVEAGPCYVVQKKTNEKDGYEALVVAFDQTKENRLNKPQLGVLKKANVAPSKILREFRFENTADYEIGKEIKADIFAESDIVDVSGTTRGRGFTGNIQRWNAHRLKMTHGVGPVHREVGSMGANSTPSRVFKNKKMPGHYGSESVTIQNLEIVKVDAERNILLVKGCLPGPKGSIVTIKEAVKR